MPLVMLVVVVEMLVRFGRLQREEVEVRKASEVGCGCSKASKGRK